MKIYTRTGDDGTTGLIGGVRVDKDSARIEAYGALDELSAAIGVARVALDGTALGPVLGRVQEELFVVGAELATAPGKTPAANAGTVGGDHVQRLEHEIDGWEETLPPLANFIVPGGTAAAAALHLARTVCRRAERRTQTLARLEAVRPEVLRYLNRLSDHLFVAARTANLLADVEDVLWRPA